MNRRGSVLMHVLVTGVIVAFIAAGLLRLAMLRYEVTARAQRSAQDKRSAEGALSLLITYWNLNNTRCADVPGSGGYSSYSCGNTGTCDCTCTPTNAADPVIRSQASADPNVCSLRIATPENALLP